MANPIRIKVVLDSSDIKSQLESALNGASIGNLSGAQLNLNSILQSSRGIGGAWDTINRGLLTFTTGLYAVDRLARGMKDAFLAPYESIIRATEAQEKFRMAMSGTVMNPRAVNAAVDQFATSPYSSISMAEMRRAAESFTHESAFAGQLSLQSPDAAAATIDKLGTLIERFQVALPDENATAIQRALENVLEGGNGGRGLRTLRIDKSDVQQILGPGQHGPNDMLDALQTLMRGRVPDSILAERAGLPSSQLQHIRDDWERLLGSIGSDSNLLSSVSGKFREIGEAINEYILSPEWAARARSIGDDMGRIASNILDAGASLLQHASGASSRANTPDAVAAQVQDVMHSLAAGSDALVPVASKAGDALHGLAGAVQAFLHSITLASEDVQERAARFDNRSNLTSYLSPSAYIGQTNQRSEALISLVDKLAGKPVLNANPMSAVDAAQQLSIGEPILKQLFYRLPQGWIAGLDGNPQVTGIKAEGQWADFASDAAQQIVSGGYAAQNGRFVSEGRITDSILMPLAKKYGLQLGQVPSAGGASQQSGPSAEELTMRDGARMYSELGVDADLASGNPYLSKFAGINKAITSLGGDSDKLDKASELLEQGATSLNTIFAKFSIGGGAPAGTFFENLPLYQRQRIAGLTEDRQGYAGVISRFGASSSAGQDAQAKIDAIDKDIALLTSMLDKTMQDALNKLGASAGKWNVEYINSLKSEDPAVRDAEISGVMAGNTDVGRRIAAARLGTTNLTPEQLRLYGGAGTIPANEQARASLEEIETHLAFLKQQGLYTNTTQSNSIFGPGVAGQQASYLRSMLPGMESQASGMTGIDAERMAAAIAKVRNEMTELEVSSNSALKSFLDFGKQSTDTIENGLGNALADVISGTQKVSTAFRAMANEILHEFTNMTVHAAFAQIPGGSGNPTPMGGGLLGGIVSFIHNLGGGGGDSKGNSPNIGGGPSVWSVSPSDSAANGAVWIPGYSAGGVARSPTILVGERSDGIPEAIVPMTAGGRIPMGVGPDGPHAILPSGQRIPGSFVGGMLGYSQGGILGHVGAGASGGGPRVMNYVVASEAEAHAHAGTQGLTPHDVVNIISHDLLKGGSTYRAVQRGGGR